MEAVRKRLKHGTTQQKIRVLEVCPYDFQVKPVGQLANSLSRRSSNYSWKTVISGSIVSEAFHLIVWFRLETHRDACPALLGQLTSNEKMRERIEIIITSPVSMMHLF